MRASPVADWRAIDVDNEPASAAHSGVGRDPRHRGCPPSSGDSDRGDTSTRRGCRPPPLTSITAYVPCAAAWRRPTARSGPAASKPVGQLSQAMPAALVRRRGWAVSPQARAALASSTRSPPAGDRPTLRVSRCAAVLVPVHLLPPSAATARGQSLAHDLDDQIRRPRDRRAVPSACRSRTESVPSVIDRLMDRTACPRAPPGALADDDRSRCRVEATPR